MTEFIKIGKNIVIKPQGADYSLEAGKVYDLSWDRYNGNYIFTENGDLNLPAKVYNLKKDESFKKRVLTYFNSSGNQTTGVMLAGVKGTGKTVLAKVMAKESGLPIIVIDSGYPASQLNKFFKGFKTPVCVIFDEIEKKWDTNNMLDFLDGIEATAKKLVLMTCNKLSLVSEYMQDRCSRVRYIRKYGARDNEELIRSFVEDNGIKNVDEVTNYITSKMCILSIDNVLAFIKEVKLMENDNITLDEIIEDMNISIFDKPLTKEESSPTTLQVATHEDYEDCEDCEDEDYCEDEDWDDVMKDAA